MMRLGIARSDDLIAHALRKGDIHEIVAMDVAKFAAAHAKFLSAVSMW
jgi:hypothetical protein